MIAPIQERQLYEHCKPDHVGTNSLKETNRRCGSAPGGYHIVDDEDLLTLLHRIDVDFESVGPVLELIVLPYRLVGQLSRLAHRDEPGAESQGDWCGQGESTCLDTRNLGDPGFEEGFGQGFDQPLQGLAVGKNRGDVLEHDSRLREVRNIANQCGEVIHELEVYGAGLGSAPTLEPMALLATRILPSSTLSTTLSSSTETMVPWMPPMVLIS